MLGLVAEGRSNAAVSSSLSVTDRTVETHMPPIFPTLGIVDGGDNHRRVHAVLAYLTR